jgi:hypothetical protein
MESPAGVGDDGDATPFEDLYSQHHLAAYRLALLQCWRGGAG